MVVLESLILVYINFRGLSVKNVLFKNTNVNDALEFTSRSIKKKKKVVYFDGCFTGC